VSEVKGRVIVVGAGVVGTACAYYLSKAGYPVTMLDRGKFGSACSHANCGFISPSHVLPLAMPGVIWSTLGSMFRSDSPFLIRPRFDLALWSWLWRFARRCNQRDMLAAGQGIQALLNSARSLYDELFASERIDCDWQTRGLLFVLQTAKAMEHHAGVEKLLRERFNMPARRYDGDAVMALEPALKPGLAGGWLYESDAHLRPDKLMDGWRAVLEARGVEIRENVEVTSFQSEGRQCRGVVTAAGTLPADAVVVATGAWTPMLNKVLGCSIPIQPGKGYSLTMARPARCPVYPMMFEEHRVAVTPMREAYRLGSTMEFAGYDTTLNPKRLELLRKGARHYLHEPEAEPVLEQWYGWRPMTPDSLPVLDRSPKMDNVWIAAGHNMLGVSMAPATGKLIAELLAGTTPHIDPKPYRVGRF
jgi:D-amino-acid dehydrogenase